MMWGERKVKRNKKTNIYKTPGGWKCVEKGGKDKKMYFN